MTCWVVTPNINDFPILFIWPVLCLGWFTCIFVLMYLYIYIIDQESKNNLVSNVSYLLKILLQAGLVKVGLRVEVLIGLSLHWK